jgi:hypothetical protein
MKLGRIEYVVSELKTPEKTLSARRSDSSNEKIYDVH